MFLILTGTWPVSDGSADDRRLVSVMLSVSSVLLHPRSWSVEIVECEKKNGNYRDDQVDWK